MRAVAISLVVVSLMIAARPASAQGPPPPDPGLAPMAMPGQPPPRAVQPAPTPQPGPPGIPVPIMTPPAIPKRSTNVHIEVIISDQLGSSAPEKKTVSMIASDGTWGRIRTGAQARPSDKIGFQQTNINVDARPFLMPNQTDTIQLELTIEYKPLRSVTAASGEVTQSEGTNLNQSMVVTLQNGKPLQISQAADPVTDRKILVEVKASILK